MNLIPYCIRKLFRAPDVVTDDEIKQRIAAVPLAGYPRKVTAREAGLLLRATCPHCLRVDTLTCGVELKLNVDVLCLNCHMEYNLRFGMASKSEVLGRASKERLEDVYMLTFQR